MSPKVVHLEKDWKINLRGVDFMKSMVVIYII